MTESRRGWLQAALYLSLAAFIAKGLSALYKIPYQNLTGDTGFYVYQQVYPLYGAVLVLGTYGFPLVIAKAVLAEKESEALRQRLTFYIVLLLLFFSCLGGGVILFAGDIAYWMGDEALTPAVRWMGAPFFLVPFFAVARGYFQGRHTTVPSAVSQVAEQFVRVVVILFTAWLAMQTADVYRAGTSAGIGASAGGVAGLVVMWLYIKKHLQWWRPAFQLPKQWPGLSRELFTQGLLVSASAMALILFQVIDAFTIVQRLPQGEAGAALKGIYDRSWPLIQFGALIITVFSYAALPAISAAWEVNRAEAAQEASKAVKICLVFGGAAAAGMLVIMPSLNVMMFTDAEGTGVLQLMTFVVLGGSLFMTAAALMHAIDKAGSAAGLLVIGLAVKGMLNYWLVPDLGIMGAAVGSAAASLLLAAAALYYLRKQGSFHFFSAKTWGKWVLSIVFMSGGVLLFLETAAFFPENRLTALLFTMSASGIGAVLFIFIVWRISLFTQSEWEELPKLGSLLPHRNLHRRNHND